MKLRLAIGIIVLAMSGITEIAMAQDNPDDSMQTVTGCLRKGAATNVYTLTDENGKLWDLQSKTVSFAPHAGHMVTISGTIPQKSKENDNPDDTSPQNHLMVAKLELVSDTCRK